MDIRDFITSINERPWYPWLIHMMAEIYLDEGALEDGPSPDSLLVRILREVDVSSTDLVEDEFDEKLLEEVGIPEWRDVRVTGTEEDGDAIQELVFWSILCHRPQEEPFSRRCPVATGDTVGYALESLQNNHPDIIIDAVVRETNRTFRKRSSGLRRFAPPERRETSFAVFLLPEASPG